MSWYAIFVETGKEEQVATTLRKVVNHFCGHVQCDLLIPKRVICERHSGKNIEKLKPMFPGYIFLETDSVWQIHRLTKHHTQHVFGLLRQYDYMLEVRLAEISRIIYLLDDNDTIHTSDIYVFEDRVMVTKGPLSQYDGYIYKVDRRKGRAKVSFQFGGDNHLIDLSVNVLEKYNNEIQGNEILFNRKRQHDFSYADKSIF